MIITCQECDSRFVLDDKLIKPAGSKVRCSSCKHVFKVFPETAVPSPVEPPTLSTEAAPVAPPPKAQPPRNLDEGDDLAEELDRELDRLFGPDDDDSFFGDSLEKESAPSVPQPEPVPVAEAAPPGSIDDIDLDDLGLTESPGELTPDDFDLSDLDLDLSLDDERVPAPATGGKEVEDELDFSDLEEDLDFSDLEVSLTDNPELASGSAAPSEESFDFADMDLSLDEEASPEAPVFDEDLDFSDLEAALEAPDAVTGTDEPDEELDFSDLSLSLDDSSGDMGLAGDAEELSLSLDDGDVEELSLGGSGELDLSLDDDLFSAASLGDEPAAATGSGVPAEDDGFMDLDLDLDLDGDDPMQAALESSLNEELDLSELESLLQEEPSAEESVLVDDDIELELDFDFQADEKTEEMAPLVTEEVEDSDFSDIEAMLESDDTPLDAVADLDEDIDLNLELDLAPEVGPVADASLGMKAEPEVALAEIDDDELEPVQKAVPREKASKTFAADRGNGLRIFFTILLVVVLLFAILVGVYAMRDKIRDRTGIAIPTIAVVEQAREQVVTLGIPGVSDWMRPEVKDPDGNLNMVTQDVAGRFVTSPTLGDLFVITGKVRNNYQTTRHSILLMGRLFTTNNREVQGKEFFAGNMMTDEELATLSMEQVDQKLKTTLGNENINARVRPGQLVPFMVVYSKLPDDLAEFAVEVRGSKEGVALK